MRIADSEFLCYPRAMKSAVQVIPPAQKSQTELAAWVSRPQDQNPAAVLLARLRPGSRPAVLGALANIVALLQKLPREGRTKKDKQSLVTAFPWQDLRYQHTQAIRSLVTEAYSSQQTINLHLSALRGVLKEAWKLGLLDAESYHRARALDSIKGSTPLGGRALSQEEVAKVFAACASDRDRALVAVLVGCGPRRAELAGLQCKHYVDGSLTIHGKRNKTRVIPVDDATRVQLDRLVFGGAPEDSIFSLTPQGVLYVLQELQKRAGVPSLSPHDCRRTYITGLLSAGVDALTVSNLAGHDSVTTTRRYDRRGDDAARAAVNTVKYPWALPTLPQTKETP